MTKATVSSFEALLGDQWVDLLRLSTFAVRQEPPKPITLPELSITLELTADRGLARILRDRAVYQAWARRSHAQRL